jgi:hypothetical protein
MRFKLLVFVGLLLLLFAIGLPSASSTGQVPVTADLWFTGGDFVSGSGVGVAKTADGLTITENESTAVYTSATIKAPIPFNAVVPQWVADVPETSSLEIMLRTAKTEGEWSQWYDIHPQPDWMLPEDPDTVGQMIAVPATAEAIQTAREPRGRAGTGHS